MASRFKVGDTAWLVENNRFIREVQVIRLTADFYVIQFKDNGGAIRVRGNRLYVTEEEARRSVGDGNAKRRDW